MDYTISMMPKNEKPREKLLANGVSSLSDQELIAILIRTGRLGSSAIDIARDIICLNDGVVGLNNITIEELMSINGIGLSKACEVLAAIELGKRVVFNKHAKTKINSPRDIYEHFRVKVANLKTERFFAVLLDTKNNILSVEQISIGTLNTSIAHPREVFCYAIKRNANSVVVVHNHPSGDCRPSEQDIMITERLVRSGEIIGINLTDHIIVCENAYYSFKEHFKI